MSQAAPVLKLMCVLDGHGSGGQSAAQFVANEVRSGLICWGVAADGVQLIRQCVLERLLLTDPFDSAAVTLSMQRAFASTQVRARFFSNRIQTETRTQAALLVFLVDRNLECGTTVILAQLVGSALVVGGSLQPLLLLF